MREVSDDLISRMLDYAKKVAKMTDSFMLELLSGEPPYLYSASKHLILAGGKRLRPLITVLAGRMYGLPEELGAKAGAAVELFHTFTLVHDDIMDRDEIRRGVPTVHVKWGEPTAILAGDLLYAKSYEALIRVGEELGDYGRGFTAIKQLTWSAITVAEGQALDMDFERRWDVSVGEYLEMIYKKTAALFRTSMVIGALLAGARGEEIEKVAAFADNIGVAFQIRDDILGIFGEERMLGKPVYSDIREGKKTILVLYALQHLSRDEAKELRHILGLKERATYEELRRAAELIEKSGAREYAEKLAADYVRRAEEALYSTNPKDREARDLLWAVATYIIQRKR